MASDLAPLVIVMFIILVVYAVMDIYETLSK